MTLIKNDYLILLRHIFFSNVDNFRMRTGISVLVFSLMIFASIMTSTFIVKKHPAAAMTIGFAAAALSMAVLAVTQCKVNAAVHVTVISFITLYQMHEYTSPHHFEAAWWTEPIILFVVTAVLTWEDILFYYEIKGYEHMPDTTRDMVHIDPEGTAYAYVGGALLLSGSLVPLHGTGLYYLDHRGQLLLFALWIAMAATEARKSLVLKGCMVPHTACKCAPLFYLHPYYWGIVCMFMMVNIWLLASYSKKSDVK